VQEESKSGCRSLSWWPDVDLRNLDSFELAQLLFFAKVVFFYAKLV